MLNGMKEIINIEIDENKYVGENVDILFELCETPQQNAMFRNIINTHHAYIEAKDTCNRRINWLIKNADNGEILGAIGINSAILVLTPRDTYIGWNKEQRLRNLNKVANNYRFAMIFRGLGSQVLSVLLREAPKVWEAKYGDRLVLLETTVKPPWDGTVYKASSWEYIGMTKGFSMSRIPVNLWKREKGRRGELANTGRLEEYGVKKNDLVKVSRTTPKHIFIKPLIRNWRKHLLS